MFFSSFPPSLEYFAIAPVEGAFSFLFTSHVFPLVPISIGPGEDSVAMHKPGLPASPIGPLILPNEVPLPPKQPIPELPLIARPRRRYVLAKPLLLANPKLPIVVRPKLERLNSPTIGLIIQPVTRISVFLLIVLINSLTVSHVVSDIPIVVASVAVGVSALAIGDAVEETTVVGRAIMKH